MAQWTFYKGEKSSIDNFKQLTIPEDLNDYVHIVKLE